MKAKRQFGLHSYPFPKDAKGKNFFDKTPSYSRFARCFAHLLEEPGLGILTSDAGVGKTAAIRNECIRVPQPDYQVIYLCDTTITSADLYRALAIELGVRPSHRRGQLWAELKKALLHMVDERGNHPIVVIDEAQHLLWGGVSRQTSAQAVTLLHPTALVSSLGRRLERAVLPGTHPAGDLPDVSFRRLVLAVEVSRSASQRTMRRLCSPP